MHIHDPSGSISLRPGERARAAGALLILLLALFAAAASPAAVDREPAAAPGADPVAAQQAAPAPLTP